MLIGKKGEAKKYLEDITKTIIEVDSKEGDIIITAEDGLKLYCCKEIITAVGRGFNPEIAQIL